jgi:hypothetical protein
MAVNDSDLVYTKSIKELHNIPFYDTITYNGMSNSVYRNFVTVLKTQDKEAIADKILSITSNCSSLDNVYTRERYVIEYVFAKILAESVSYCKILSDDKVNLSDIRFNDSDFSATNTIKCDNVAFTITFPYFKESFTDSDKLDTFSKVIISVVNDAGIHQPSAVQIKTLMNKLTPNDLGYMYSWDKIGVKIGGYNFKWVIDNYSNII